MTTRKDPFVIGEWHHCYNQSIEGRIAFIDSQDYARFLELLYLSNDETRLRRGDLPEQKLEEILALPRGKRLVTIGAFSLMPDHFNFALKEVVDGGISSFMRKMGTAYTLYFNARHKRMGNLFLKPFKSLRVSTDRLPHLISYVHCSPATLSDPNWKSGPVVDPQFLGERIAAYPYSSIGVYSGTPSRVSPIVDKEISSMARTVSIEKMLQEARRYRAYYSID